MSEISESKEELQEKQPESDAAEMSAPPAAGENPMIRKRWFGRGIYGSKDVPIRFLDGFIALVIAAIIGMIIFFAVNGGFTVTFDTNGGSETVQQKLKHGSLVKEPEEPIKPGYTFNGWYLESNPEAAWNFAVDKIEGDLTLTAGWVPAQITVKFDLNGGSLDGREEAEPKTVTFSEVYGELPEPEKDGAVFDGWYYSGSKITPDTTVIMTGEHVLTAEWK